VKKIIKAEEIQTSSEKEGIKVAYNVCKIIWDREILPSEWG